MFPIPPPIAAVNLESIPDETGFTSSEKLALKYAWELLIPHLHRYAVDQFVEFFNDNEPLVDFFRNDHGEINMIQFHLHKHKMFDILELFIMDAIESLPKMYTNVAPLITMHMRCNLTMSAYKILADDLHVFVKNALKRYMSPCLESGIDKLFNFLQESHEERLEP